MAKKAGFRQKKALKSYDFKAFFVAGAQGLVCILAKGKDGACAGEGGGAEQSAGLF